MGKKRKPEDCLSRLSRLAREVSTDLEIRRLRSPLLLLLPVEDLPGRFDLDSEVEYALAGSRQSLVERLGFFLFSENSSSRMIDLTSRTQGRS